MNAVTAVPDLPMPAWMAEATTPAKLARPDSIMLYGMPGTRKTTIAASIRKVPGFNKVLFLDIDRGTTVLSQHRWADDIQVMKFNALDNDALARVDYIVKDITKNNYGFDAVILDTVDVGQDISERQSELRNAASGKGGTRDGFAVYREIGEWVDTTVRRLHESPNFTAIFTMHAKEQTSETGAYRLLPRLSGSTKDSIGGVPDLVAYLKYEKDEADQNRLVAYMGASETMITKKRFNIPDQIVDFDMPTLYKAIDASRPLEAETTTEIQTAAAA